MTEAVGQIIKIKQLKINSKIRVKGCFIFVEFTSNISTTYHLPLSGSNSANTHVINLQVGTYISVDVKVRRLYIDEVMPKEDEKKAFLCKYVVHLSHDS